MIDALGNEFHAGNVVILIEFQRFYPAIIINGTDTYVYVQMNISSSWFYPDPNTGRFLQMVLVDPRSIDRSLLEKLYSQIRPKPFPITDVIIATDTHTSVDTTTPQNITTCGLVEAGVDSSRGLVEVGGLVESGKVIALDALGRELRIGDRVAIRKTTKFEGSGIVTGCTDTYLLLDG